MKMPSDDIGRLAQELAAIRGRRKNTPLLAKLHESQALTSIFGDPSRARAWLLWRLQRPEDDLDVQIALASLDLRNQYAGHDARMSACEASFGFSPRHLDRKGEVGFAHLAREIAAWTVAVEAHIFVDLHDLSIHFVPHRETDMAACEGRGAFYSDDGSITESTWQFDIGVPAELHLRDALDGASGFVTHFTIDFSWPGAKDPMTINVRASLTAFPVQASLRPDGAFIEVARSREPVTLMQEVNHRWFRQELDYALADDFFQRGVEEHERDRAADAAAAELIRKAKQS